MKFSFSGMLCATAVAVTVGLAGGPVLADSGRSTADLPVAAQMYSLRNFGTLDEQLAAVEAAGVTAVETFGSTDDLSADDYKTELDQYNIAVISHHSSLDALRSGDIQSMIDFEKALGNDTIVLPYVAPDLRPTDEAGWQALGIELAGYAKEFAAQDMQFAYHNHNFEMVEYNGRTALEILLDAAGPGVKLELDVAWAQRGGQNPADLLEKFQGRVFAIHAKDNGAAGDPNTGGSGFVSIGDGTMNWTEVLPAADAAGVEWYIIEHDNAKDIATSLKTSATYLNAHVPADAARPE
ncbi:sugar phosphate isomerase/epimerase family protein [Martelella mangrovi]|uniref:Sugar phosphate isomerase/epimerase n=1 Tax=Martelella mangrovi TaxID=1397477 RepID=A0ABV2IA16_9HYPH